MSVVVFDEEGLDVSSVDVVEATVVVVPVKAQSNFVLIS